MVAWTNPRNVPFEELIRWTANSVHCPVIRFFTGSETIEDKFGSEVKAWKCVLSAMFTFGVGHSRDWTIIDPSVPISRQRVDVGKPPIFSLRVRWNSRLDSCCRKSNSVSFRVSEPDPRHSTGPDQLLGTTDQSARQDQRGVRQFALG